MKFQRAPIIDEEFFDTNTAKDFLDARFRENLLATRGRMAGLPVGNTMACPQIMTWLVKEIDRSRLLNGMCDLKLEFTSLQKFVQILLTTCFSSGTVTKRGTRTTRLARLAYPYTYPRTETLKYHPTHMPTSIRPLPLTTTPLTKDTEHTHDLQRQLKYIFPECTLKRRLKFGPLPPTLNTIEKIEQSIAWLEQRYPARDPRKCKNKWSKNSALKDAYNAAYRENGSLKSTSTLPPISSILNSPGISCLSCSGISCSHVERSGVKKNRFGEVISSSTITQSSSTISPRYYGRDYDSVLNQPSSPPKSPVKFLQNCKPSQSYNKSEEGDQD